MSISSLGFCSGFGAEIASNTLENAFEQYKTVDEEYSLFFKYSDVYSFINS